MEKRRLSIAEIQERLKEMGRRVSEKKERTRPAIPPIRIPKDLPVPYYNLMD